MVAAGEGHGKMCVDENGQEEEWSGNRGKQSTKRKGRKTNEVGGESSQALS